MKKKELRKLRLSRETLRDLEKRDVQKVVGGMSPMTGCWPRTGDGDTESYGESGCEAC